MALYEVSFAALLQLCLIHLGLVECPHQPCVVELCLPLFTTVNNSRENIGELLAAVRSTAEKR